MINIRFSADPIPADFTGTLQDFQDRFLLNLRGTIDDSQVLAGQIGGSKPDTDVGPWLNGDSWHVWNGSEYVPTTVKVGGAGFVVQLGDYTTVGDTGILPTNVQTLQDKDGVIALLSDVYVGRPCVILSGTTPTIDWNLGHHFALIPLSGNTTFKIANSQDGQRVVVAVRNAATTYTVTWPSSIFWTGGSAPTQSVTNKTDLYILDNIGGSVFGRQIAAYI